MAPRPPADDVVESVLGPDGTVAAVLRLTALQHGAAVASGCDDPAALGELGPVGAGLVDKVARHAYRVGDDDIDAARAAGWSEHELFDLVVTTAVGAGLRRRALGRSAIDRWERAR
jgi:hypothetical protein